MPKVMWPLHLSCGLASVPFLVPELRRRTWLFLKNAADCTCVRPVQSQQWLSNHFGSSQYALAQALRSTFRQLTPCCSMICMALLATLAAVTVAAAQETSPEVGWDAAWQDAKLLLSFAVGIIFMRSLEVLTVGPDQRQGQPKTIELYQFLA
eukprot:Skav227934  [mRNA]  locus=scaffold146:439721:441199:+ [translate_table: standard]